MSMGGRASVVSGVPRVVMERGATGSEFVIPLEADGASEVVTTPTVVCSIISTVPADEGSEIGSVVVVSIAVSDRISAIGTGVKMLYISSCFLNLFNKRASVAKF